MLCFFLLDFEWNYLREYYGEKKDGNELFEQEGKMIKNEKKGYKKHGRNSCWF